MMPLDLSPLAGVPRLLIEADLQPLQGTRFQPTGFPGLGHAVYDSPDGTGKMLLVESAQSMGNIMERACLNDLEEDWIEPLQDLPLVEVVRNGLQVTNSILEAHRLNSEYIARNDGFEVINSEFNYHKDKPFSVRRQLVPVLLKYDPNSLLHGVFLEEVAGVIRLPRALAGFIEAFDARNAPNGGVKFNKVEPGLKDGDGNVPYSRDDWTAGRITAFFRLDLQQIRSYGLSQSALEMLVLLGFFKIRRALDLNLHRRSNCFWNVLAERTVLPAGWTLPGAGEILSDLHERIADVKGEGGFFNERKLTLNYQSTKKKKSSARANSSAGEGA